MAKHVRCTGETLADCMECGSYHSSHSLHYDHTYKEKVVDISCCIGGNKTFNEQGKEID